MTHYTKVGVPKNQIEKAIEKGSKEENPEFIDNFAKNILPQILSDNKGSPILKNIVISSIWVAFADGLHEKEQQKANEIALKLGMTQKQFDKLMTMWQKEKDLFDEYYGILMDESEQ